VVHVPGLSGPASNIPAVQLRLTVSSCRHAASTSRVAWSIERVLMGPSLPPPPPPPPSPPPTSGKAAWSGLCAHVLIRAENKTATDMSSAFFSSHSTRSYHSVTHATIHDTVVARSLAPPSLPADRVARPPHSRRSLTMPPLLVHGSCVMLLKPDRQEEVRDPG